MTRTIILRTTEEKGDLERCWSCPDHEFFASGACHVLAAAFLIEYPRAGFEAWQVVPRTSSRGGHVVVMQGGLVCDWAGYEARELFLTDYFAAMRCLIPDWDANFVRLESDPIGWEFCARHHHRHPTQFLSDPLPRARAFARNLPPP